MDMLKVGRFRVGPFSPPVCTNDTIICLYYATYAKKPHPWTQSFGSDGCSVCFSEFMGGKLLGRSLLGVRGSLSEEGLKTIYATTLLYHKYVSREGSPVPLTSTT